MWPLSRAPVPIRVHTVDTELEYLLAANATGKELFECVTKTIGLRETWFFGLQYRDSKGYDAWLEMNAKVMSQDVAKVKYDDANRLKFELKVKFYPEDVNEIIQESTLRFFYLQIRAAILADDIYCPAPISIVLAACALQAQHGDHSEGFTIHPEMLLPSRVVQQHSTEKLAEHIDHWWQTLAGTSSEDALRQYLKFSIDLEMCGVNYFPVTNKKGTKLLVGIDAHGLNVYKPIDKLTPVIGFPWSEIRTVSFDKKTFMIKPIDKKSPPFVCLLSRSRFARRMLLLASGNHDFYLSRRRPDTAEMTQMKAQAAKEKATKARERERLQLEREAHQLAVKERQLLEQQLAKLTEEAQRKVFDLSEAQEKICRLEEQLEAVRKAKEAIERQHTELETLNAQLAESTRLEAAERAKLAEEVAAKQNLYDRALEKLQAQDSERKRLQAEMEKKAPLGGDQLIGRSNSQVDLDAKSDNDEQAEQLEVHLDVADDETQLMRSEEFRETHISQVKSLQEQLKELNDELSLSADLSKLTDNDRLHIENFRKGMNKYKTLRAIRKGNTMRRIDYFESM